MRLPVRCLFAMLAVGAGPALAEARADSGVPAEFQALLDCRTVTEPGERLACFDRSVAVLDQAARSREVLVVDRATAQQTKRSLFGLALPRVKLFGDGDDEEVLQVDTTIASTYTGRDGMTVFVLPDGARWKQTEGRNTYAKSGQPILIRKGSLGSFFARINNQTGVRVIRLQ